MSKKLKKQPKPTSKSVVSEMPNLTSYKTEWDLAGLYYKSETDPQIEKDIKKVERAYKKFASLHKDGAYISSSTKLAASLQDLEKLVAMPESRKAGRYLSFRLALNTNDLAAEKLLQLLSDRLTKASNQILFFELMLGSTSIKQQNTFLTSPALKPYRYYLKRVFLTAKHNLTEAEEKILNLKSSPSSGMWMAATEKLLGNRSITYKGEEIPFNEALERVNSLPMKQKPLFWSLLTKEMEALSEFAEPELNAVITDKKIDDELRKYKLPYSATILAYEDDQKSVEALVAAVSSKGFELSKRFYKQKAAMHGVATLDYSQKYESIGSLPKIEFTEAVDICRETFYGLKPLYGEIFDTMLQNGQIDAFPKKGKRGGAFMSDGVNVPTQVFLNHTDDFRSLQTLAHEMGHAIHGQRSKTQTPLYQGHSITTAETASTLFENLVFDYVFSVAPAKDKTILLHEKIVQNIATIQRQIACFNYELELHQRIRNEGALSREEMRSMMVRHMQAYLGPGIKVRDTDGYIYVYWSHLRYGFYVYTYTFGILMSNLMANRYREDTSYLEKIDAFLCLGCSDTVANIFAQAELDTSTIATFQAGLKQLDDDISTLNRLVKVKK